MVIIEVHLAPGKKSFELSEEIIAETKAQVMTHAEAAGVGFEGLPPPPAGREVRYVAVRDTDSRWILNSLEANPDVGSFKMHNVD
ncbi:MAG TPA: hypothetical protein VGG39_16595 [Polyangiaceae bacterium]|jgi:hypothetical protein